MIFTACQRTLDSSMHIQNNSLVFYIYMFNLQNTSSYHSLQNTLGNICFKQNKFPEKNFKKKKKKTLQNIHIFGSLQLSTSFKPHSLITKSQPSLKTLNHYNISFKKNLKKKIKNFSVDVYLKYSDIRLYLPVKSNFQVQRSL